METNLTPVPEPTSPGPLPQEPLGWVGWAAERLIAAAYWCWGYRWRFVLAAVIAALAVVAWKAEPWIGLRGRAALGIVCFIAAVATFSADLRAINWRTVGTGMLLQLLLALFILKFAIP